MARAPKDQIPFTLISLDDIRGRHPVDKIFSDRTGSQWDAAVNALRRKGATHGIRVPCSTKEERNHHKQPLQTFAKSHALFIKVLDDADSTDFFAWLSNEVGRFAGPRLSN